MVVDHGARVKPAAGRSFWKMSGSGNDFIFFDSRDCHGPDALENPREIVSLCAPHLGVGADGVVFIHPSHESAFAIHYYNADGSRATLCGNASLCAAQMAVMLGLADCDRMFSFMSDAGLIAASATTNGLATVRLAPVEYMETVARELPVAGEVRIGYAVVGVPHLVVLVEDLEQVDVPARGHVLRHSSVRAPVGANVNFAAPTAELGGWSVRTYERGVEAETLACGTGAVATAGCLRAWGVASTTGPVALKTASGKVLSVSLPVPPDAGWSELSGEGRVVYRGVLERYR